MTVTVSGTFPHTDNPPRSRYVTGAKHNENRCRYQRLEVFLAAWSGPARAAAWSRSDEWPRGTGAHYGDGGAGDVQAAPPDGSVSDRDDAGATMPEHWPRPE
jgi:hypothetical protein